MVIHLREEVVNDNNPKLDYGLLVLVKFLEALVNLFKVEGEENDQSKN